MDTVHVCPERDIECGSVPLYWCATCPKVEPWEARLRASAAPPPAADAVSEAMREADAVVAKLRALHRTTMGYEDACVLRGAEMVADAIRAALDAQRPDKDE